MSIYTEAVAEVVAVGAAIAANCEACLKFHYARARELGVSREDLAKAIATAQDVKEAPARHILTLANRLCSCGCQADNTGATESTASCCAATAKKKSCFNE